MFALEVTFLTGRYVATEYDDRTKAEWPPHPARIFSALVATHAADPHLEEREALQWLEDQGPPEIAASSAAKREVVTVFVPVNDVAGVGQSRVRKPRTFPSTCPDDPRVVLVWPAANVGETCKVVLDRLCAKVTRIGHSSSFVSVRVVDETPPTDWRPSERGDRWLRVVREGQVERLNRAFEAHRETMSGRVLPAAFQLYERGDVARLPAPPCSEFGQDWVILRQNGGRGLAATAGPSLAGTIRRALIRFATPPIPGTISGHSPSGEASEHTHLAVVSLPFVGHEHADGRILGVGIVLPREVSADDRRATYRALDAWQKQGGQEARDIVVINGQFGELRFTRLDEDAEQKTLQVEAWCSAAKTWLSATPVALDRNPGDLRSRDARVAAQAHAEAEEVIRRACERIRLPRPMEVTVLPAAPLAGAAKARAYGEFPDTPGRVKRVLTHVRLRFEAPVQGPVLIGAGRYLGLGLFRPMEDRCT